MRYLKKKLWCEDPLPLSCQKRFSQQTLWFYQRKVKDIEDFKFRWSVCLFPTTFCLFQGKSLFFSNVSCFKQLKILYMGQFGFFVKLRYLLKNITLKGFVPLARFESCAEIFVSTFFFKKMFWTKIEIWELFVVNSNGPRSPNFLPKYDSFFILSNPKRKKTKLKILLM